MQTALMIIAFISIFISFLFYINFLYDYDEKREQDIKETKRKQYYKHFKK
jgi:cellobiose-specific phosphotransferase system component IIC